MSHYVYEELTGLLARAYTGDLDEETDPAAGDGEEVTDTRYTYDSLGRLTTVTVVERDDVPLTAPEKTEYRYDLAGNLDKEHLPGDAVSDYDYDEFNRLVKLTIFDDANTDWVKGESETLLSEYIYDLAADGKRKGATERTLVDAALVETRIDWLYDNLGRLTQEDYDYDTAAAPSDDDFVADYVYDLAGNRRQKTVDYPDSTGNDETIDYVYDANDRLLFEKTDLDADAVVDQTTIYSYHPDAWGVTTLFLGGSQTQLMRKTTWNGDVLVDFDTDEFDPSGHSLIGKTQYAYNLQGRMSETLIDEDGNGDPDRKIDYEYDDDGIRVSQTETEDTVDDNVFDEEPTATEYLYDKHNPTGYAQILEETEEEPGTDPVTKTYTLGHDVIGQSDSTNGSLFLLYDGHGSTRGLVDATGQPLSEQIFRYDAFGKRLDESIAATSLLYSGENTDLTGLQYLRARYYDPNVGRFNRLDPFRGEMNDPVSLHKYLYAHANPVMRVDPSGEVGMLVSFFAGLASRSAIEYAQMAGIAVAGFGTLSLITYAAEAHPDDASYGTYQARLDYIRALAEEMQRAGDTFLAGMANYDYNFEPNDPEDAGFEALDKLYNTHGFGHRSTGARSKTAGEVAFFPGRWPLLSDTIDYALANYDAIGRFNVCVAPVGWRTVWGDSINSPIHPGLTLGHDTFWKGIGGGAWIAVETYLHETLHRLGRAWLGTGIGHWSHWLVIDDKTEQDAFGYFTTWAGAWQDDNQNSVQDFITEAAARRSPPPAKPC